MTGWLKNYSPQRFLISFGLAAFIGLMASVVSTEDHLKLVGFIPEGNIFKAYSDGIGEIRQEEYGDS